MKHKDPIIEELHRIRQEWLSEYDNDLKALYEDLMSQPRDPSRTYVSFSPQPYPPVVDRPE